MVDDGVPERATDEHTRVRGRRAYLAMLAAGVATPLAGCGFGVIGAQSTVPKLAAADGDRDDEFGTSVALDGDTALVGAPGEEDPNGARSGAAYVFSRDGEWRQQAKLVPEGGESDDRFGASVALDGDTALIGAPGDEHPGTEGAGAAYVFSRDGEWRQATRFAPDTGNADDVIGASVALDVDTALVGVVGDADFRFEDAVAAYVLSRADGEWTERAALNPEDGEGDSVGVSVALADDVAVVGEFNDEAPNGSTAGSAYAFVRDGGAWRLEATLDPDDDDAYDQFGSSVALDGDTALVGASWDEAPDGDRTGTTYAFSRDGGDWTQEAELVASNGDADDGFGSAVAFADDTALVGAPDDDDPNGEFAGAAYVFERSGEAWSQRRKLAPADGNFLDRFGTSVALSGDTALVGSEDDEPNGESAGAAYVYET